MASDGQGARDYGTHLLPESDWTAYGTCPEYRCKATNGQPCVDLRYRRQRVPTWLAHPQRPTRPTKGTTP